MIMQSLHWVQHSVRQPLPQDALPVGRDVDTSVMYVGRIYDNGEPLVVKVIPSKHLAYVAMQGKEKSKEQYEILCGRNFGWRACNDRTSMPQNAVTCGISSTKEPIYIGRGQYKGSLTVGKVSQKLGGLFIPFGGGEVRLDAYEILIQENNSPAGWAVTPVPMEEKKISTQITSAPPPYAPNYPSFPTQMGYAPQQPYAPLQQACAPPQPSAPPQCFPQQHVPQTFYPQQQIGSQTFFPQQTFGTTFYPLQQQQQHQGMQKTFFPQQTIVSSSDQWVSASSGYLPPRAFRAGYDSDKEHLYIGRAVHNGDQLPGKVVSSHNCAYVCYDGKEIPKHNYEVLVGDNYRWVACSNGNVPPGAVEGGRTASGEKLFIGRGPHNNSLTPGKIQPSHNCLYIPYGGEEHRIYNFEVLIH